MSLYCEVKRFYSRTCSYAHSGCGSPKADKQIIASQTVLSQKVVFGSEDLDEDGRVFSSLIS